MSRCCDARAFGFAPAHTAIGMFGSLSIGALAVSAERTLCNLRASLLDVSAIGKLEDCTMLKFSVTARSFLV